MGSRHYSHENRRYFSVACLQTLQSRHAASDSPRSPLMDGFRLPDRSSRIAGQSSELQSRLKRDHSWTAITTQADAQQAGGRRSCGGERAKSILRGRISWNAGLRSPSLPPR